MAAVRAPLLFRVGDSLVDSGLIADAANYLLELVANATRHLGADHPDTLRARYRLAAPAVPAGT